MAEIIAAEAPHWDGVKRDREEVFKYRYEWVLVHSFVEKGKPALMCFQLQDSNPTTTRVLAQVSNSNEHPEIFKWWILGHSTGYCSNLGDAQAAVNKIIFKE